MIEVISPGLYSLVQDLGRDGYYAIGMPPSGALDRYSHSVANLLVGNTIPAATLEVTFLGPELLFHSTTMVAVTGATLPVWLDGEPVEQWTPLAVSAGQTLKFGMMTAGCRVYIAVAGGIDTVPFLGSRSTYATSAIGGLDGRPLKSGDKLPMAEPGPSRKGPRPGVRLPERFIPKLGKEYELRVVEGLCNYRFQPDSLETFFSTDYGVTSESNRIGYRFHGERLQFMDRAPVFGAGDNPSNVVDLGYPMGSIQVPDGAEPICLLRDAVTGGGYATLGTVIARDLDLLAQAKVPDRVRFTRIGIDQALELRHQQQARINEVASALGA
ncbi:biotin-dependent carboxyltransferase family protein [Arthrobacter ginkgonis]|uniref:Biotin-dependent carboxyltransferase family protein n=1 Tax=Arthrobacter ginkgonis TaxID=1630594 RepID=A0ABP7CJW1_9MICC